MIDIDKLKQIVTDADDSDFGDVIDPLPTLLAVYEHAKIAAEAYDKCGIEPPWNGYCDDQRRLVDALESLLKLTRSKP